MPLENPSIFAQLEVPSLNESAPADTGVGNPDMFATKMKFGDKEEGVLDMMIYSFQDQNVQTKIASSNLKILIW